MPDGDRRRGTVLVARAPSVGAVRRRRRAADGRGGRGINHLVVGPGRVVKRVEASDGRLVAEGAVWSAAIVEVDPAGQRGGALAAVAVDRTVGPAGQQGADEAFGLAIGLGAVGPRAQVADAERAAGDGVDGRDVGAVVVGHHALDVDAVAGVVRDGAAQKPDRGQALLV